MLIITIQKKEKKNSKKLSGKAEPQHLNMLPEGQKKNWHRKISANKSWHFKVLSGGYDFPRSSINTQKYSDQTHVRTKCRAHSAVFSDY